MCLPGSLLQIYSNNQMAYNTLATERIDIALKALPRDILEQFSKRQMFRGLSLLYNGKMANWLVKGDLAVKVVAEKMNPVRKHPHIMPMDFTTRPIKEFVFQGYRTEKQLCYYLGPGLEHATKAVTRPSNS